MGDWTTIVDRAELVSFVAAAWLGYEEPPPSPPPAAPVAEEMGSTPRAPAGICGLVCGQLGTRGAGVQVRVTLAGSGRRFANSSVAGNTWRRQRSEGAHKIPNA